MSFFWISLGADQPSMCQIGGVAYYKHADGHVTCSVSGSYISALFESPEAAETWDGFWLEAEKEFAKLNSPSGKGEKLLPARRTPTVVE